MKKHLLFTSNILVMLVIFICFSGMMYTDSTSYHKLVSEHVESVVSMSSENIKSEIETDLSEQLTVARSMANNTMLQEWLSDETNHINDTAYLEKMYNYLKKYQKEYGYTTVFCISEASKNYYYQGGFNKTLHRSDNHDIWYYYFTENKHEYDIQVDKDEINNNAPTVFINYRMHNEEGKLIGVVGVAVELKDVQKLISKYEKNYNTSIYLINRGSSKNSFTQNTDYFIKSADLAKKLNVKEDLLLTTSSKGKLTWFDGAENEECVYNTYTSALKCNIIVVKNTDSLMDVFLKRLKNNLLGVVGILLGCISVTTFIFYQFNNRMLELENVDELTGLKNRKLFEKEYHKLVKNSKGKKTLFMIDVDNFKTFNDTKGHLYGNVILSMVGEKIRDVVEDKGTAARWGGDEFIGVLYCDGHKAEEILKDLMSELGKEEAITLSIGIMEIEGSESLADAMDKADKALYEAKEGGKDKVVKYLE